MVSTAESRRHAARLRMQKHRANVRGEAVQLREEVQFLQTKLDLIMALPRGRKRGLNAYALATSVLLNSHENLKRKVDNHTKLTQLLAWWVASLDPHHGLSLEPRTPWIESSLLAEPQSRQYGYQWLSEKAYNVAMVTCPRKHFGTSIEDAVRVTARLGEDDFGVSIEMLEAHSQLTVFVDYKVAALAFWASQLKSNQIMTAEIIAEVNKYLVYFCQHNHASGTRQYYVMALFEDKDRIVVTQTMVAKDECFPMADGECRFQGFGGIIFDRLADNMTLYRRSMQYVPVNNQGSLSVEDMGRLFHRQVRGVRYRLALIEQLSSMMEVILQSQSNHIRDTYKAIEV
ncbi:unnamed protein product [Aphanomyces euteiches]|uniref:BZIP domain-containing protein n=1 Tax=Aphanomyces euteiches TaxID=100861 RepID=A0A6G0WI01_9STRA|nr:hypothetical protein Ae201684_014984 [Aphanomyces euteiches]KAH9076597.1 hypothetical protein Ae201684P_010537 [Aphanomyces euteiches]KAH9145520.1 hypothetical protein AeRB84_010562 [Aphanomyces euteiches]